MVQNVTKRRPGRPRAYDPDVALQRAVQTFWRRGYSATSLDDLSAAMDMNRPSLYAAFGDKRDLYLKTLDRYTHLSVKSIEETLDFDLPLEQALRNFYARAVSSYLPPGDLALGCYLIGTAATEASTDSEIAGRLNGALRAFDKAIRARLRYAAKHEDLPADADPDDLAVIVSGVLYMLAVRSRAGEPKAALEEFVDRGVRHICGKRKGKKA
jgi:AcrR family transcriptional regulator